MMDTTKPPKNPDLQTQKDKAGLLTSQLKWFGFLWVCGVIVVACIAYGLKALMGI